MLQQQVFLGCSSNKNSDDNKVRVGFFPNITHAQALIGKNQGKFQKLLGDKYPIEWKQFNAGPAEIEALLAGELDIAYVGPGPAVNGYARSKGEIQIISGASDAGAVLIARKDAGIKEVKDLQGKKVGHSSVWKYSGFILKSIIKRKWT
ncbi:ABC-type nitrate/sulfonate/bicarbonate transport system, periplasmic component [Clostridium carboxidivorans P7]|uniref:ABC-type nitrate/sulfonate/bicarbonate transport system, periplasmic component n=1 Tax=Clostridium carboxidivorans P7 TaxID=536227 RepID=C6PNZ9_9CLOT|nr:PhnD/SsuA/transferrin family substrate-binding protein [Clostridium carboxidivorans]EET89077.1 ABC-type nitrate/sulfonate/bicarbonate transport system, periplasmic component [Clostridium carboxidivorans P7]